MLGLDILLEYFLLFPVSEQKTNTSLKFLYVSVIIGKYNSAITIVVEGYNKSTLYTLLMCLKLSLYSSSGLRPRAICAIEFLPMKILLKLNAKLAIEVHLLCRYKNLLALLPVHSNFSKLCSSHVLKV